MLFIEMQLPYRLQPWYRCKYSQNSSHKSQEHTKRKIKPYTKTPHNLSPEGTVHRAHLDKYSLILSNNVESKFLFTLNTESCGGVHLSCDWIIEVDIHKMYWVKVVNSFNKPTSSSYLLCMVSISNSKEGS